MNGKSDAGLHINE